MDERTKPDADAWREAQKITDADRRLFEHKEARLNRIEEKVDRILALLEQARVSRGSDSR
jgi:hypothetical protein